MGSAGTPTLPVPQTITRCGMTRTLSAPGGPAQGAPADDCYGTSFQNQVETLQRGADAVAERRARVLLTLRHAITAGVPGSSCSSN